MRLRVIQSVQRALHILDFLAAAAVRGEGGVALRNVAEHMGLAPNTAHNLLKTMVAAGYAAQDSERRYGLGPHCAALGRGAHLAGPVRLRVESAVARLARDTGESAVLALLIGGRRQVAVRMTGGEAIRVDPSIDDERMLFNVVTGRVLAAYAGALEFEEILAVHGMPGAKWDGIRSRDALDAALSRIREQGYAQTGPDGQEVTSLAVPVGVRGGRAEAALGLYMPSFRSDESRLQEIRCTLERAAASIAQAMGDSAHLAQEG